MSNTVNFSVRIDSEIKQECESLFGELGMTLTTAINVFLRQAIRDGGMPFEVKVGKPNKETIAALLEGAQLAYDPDVKRYTDLDELFEDLRA